MLHTQSSCRRPRVAMRAIVAIALVVMAMPLLLTGCAESNEVATPLTIDFVVEGMHCDGCAEAITMSVDDVPGVTACRVDHEKGTASIDVLTRDTEIEARLAEAIAKLGFVVRRPLS